MQDKMAFPSDKITRNQVVTTTDNKRQSRQSHMAAHWGLDWSITTSCMSTGSINPPSWFPLRGGQNNISSGRSSACAVCGCQVSGGRMPSFVARTKMPAHEARINSSLRAFNCIGWPRQGAKKLAYWSLSKLNLRKTRKQNETDNDEKKP